jgi:hypothetical protein
LEASTERQIENLRHTGSTAASFFSTLRTPELLSSKRFDALPNHELIILWAATVEQ